MYRELRLRGVRASAEVEGFGEPKIRVKETSLLGGGVAPAGRLKCLSPGMGGESKSVERVDDPS